MYKYHENQKGNAGDDYAMFLGKLAYQMINNLYYWMLDAELGTDSTHCIGNTQGD